MQTVTPRQRTFWTAAALLLAAVLAYLPLWNAQFINMDDSHYVTTNPVVKQGLTWNGITWAFEDSHVANYHPVTWLSHMLDCSLFGTNPRGHHLTNLLIHAVNGVLVFLLLRTLTGRHWASAFVGGIFAVHPQHVESVAWVSERKDVLSGLFWLLTIAAYAWYVRRGTFWRYALVMLGLTLGLLSKAMVVTLPCVLLLLDAWPLGRTRWFEAARTDDQPADAPPRQRSLPFLLLEKVPLLLLAIGCSVITFLAQRQDGAVVGIDAMGPTARLANAVVSYVRYLRKFVVPTDLAAYYPHPENGRWPTLMVIASVALLLQLSIAILWLSRRRPYLGVGWLWFLGTLVPVIGIVQVGSQSLADRYMYLPMIGVTMMLAWLAAEWSPRVGRRATAFAAAAVLLGCSAVTFHDARAWQNSEKLFTRAIERTGPNVFSLRCLGGYHLGHDRPEVASEFLRQAVDLQPNNPYMRRALATALRAAKRYDEAIDHLQVSINVKSDDPETWITLGHVFADQKMWDAAAEHYGRAAKLAPDNYDAWNNLAVADHERGNVPAALEALRQAVRVSPKIAQPWYMYGRMLLEAGQPAAAIVPLGKATRLDPALIDAHYRLGLALMQSGRGGEATGPLITAVQLAPASPEPLIPLAWLLATHPDPKQRSGKDAAFLATRADELSKSKSPEALDALAAALAEQKQFPDAARAAEKALALAKGRNDAKLVEQIEVRAARYRGNQPARDASLAGADTANAVE